MTCPFKPNSITPQLKEMNGEWRPEVIHRELLEESRGLPLINFFVQNNCTEGEQNQLRAFLFVLRNPRINFLVLEGIMKKYADILITDKIK